MNNSLLSFGSLFGRPRSFLVFLRSLISINPAPSTFSIAAKAESISSLVLTLATYLYPQASATFEKLTSKPMVGWPPTESCEPLNLQPNQ